MCVFANNKTTILGAKYQFRTKSLPLVLQSPWQRLGLACPLQEYLQKHEDEKCTWQHGKQGQKLKLSNSMTACALFSNRPSFWQLQPIFWLTLRGHNPWIPKLSNRWQNTDNPRRKPELPLDILHFRSSSSCFDAVAAVSVLWWIDGRPSCTLWWWHGSHLSWPKYSFRLRYSSLEDCQWSNL